jgi:hypothetical protein
MMYATFKTLAEKKDGSFAEASVEVESDGTGWTPIDGTQWIDGWKLDELDLGDWALLTGTDLDAIEVER